MKVKFDEDQNEYNIILTTNELANLRLFICHVMSGKCLHCPDRVDEYYSDMAWDLEQEIRELNDERYGN